MKARSIVALLVLAGALAAKGWNIKLFPPPPAQFTIYQMWSCQITNPEKETQKVKLHGFIERDGKKIGDATSTPIELRPGLNRIIYRNLKGYEKAWWDKKYEELARRGGKLPPGNYHYCVEVYTFTADRVRETVVAKDCNEINIKEVSKIRLISPKDGAVIREGFPTFVWTPVTPPVKGVTYNLLIAEVPEDIPESISEEELQRCPPIHEEKGIRTTSFKYPLSARKLEMGKRYAWQVIACVEREEITKSKIWDFKYGKGKGPCECGEWSNLSISWDGGSQSLLPCDYPPTTVFVPSGTEVTVGGEYSCNPDDPDICPVTYEWWCHTVDIQPPYSLISSQYSGGQIGTQVDECNFSFTVEEAQCCSVYIWPYCGGEKCASTGHFCQFCVCAESECQCGDWNSLTVEVNGTTYDIDCSEDTINLGEIPYGTVITVDPNYSCEPSDTNLCPVTYTGTVTSPGGSVTPVTALDYSLIETGCYEFVITPICGTDTCGSCIFWVCDTIITDTCKCWKWGEPHILVEWDEPWGSQSEEIDCEGGITTIPSINTNIEDPGKEFTITPHYYCVPSSVSPTYEWTVWAPGGTPYGSGTFSSNLVITLEPITQTQLLKPCYKVQIIPICCGKTCDTCTFAVCDTILTDTCECGKWSSLNVSWDNESQSMLPCGQETVFVNPGTEVTVSGEYICNPDDPDICPDKYQWHVWDESGNYVTTNPPCPSSPSAPCEFSFTSGATGCYKVAIMAYCDEIKCKECDFWVCTGCNIDSMIVPSLATNTIICDGSGQTAVVVTNPPGQWTSALETEYGAQWLWDNSSGTADPPSGESHEFCTTFEIPAECEVESAKLLISADDKAPNVWLNGNYIGSHTGYDVVGSYNINPSYFVNGQNTLKIKVKDDAIVHYDDRAGGTWCLIIYFQ